MEFGRAYKKIQKLIKWINDDITIWKRYKNCKLENMKFLEFKKYYIKKSKLHKKDFSKYFQVEFRLYFIVI